MRRISTLVRRSTSSVSARAARRRACPRPRAVTPCQWSDRRASRRGCGNVQVRMWAMRLDSVSMSPSCVGKVDLAARTSQPEACLRASGSHRASSPSRHARPAKSCDSRGPGTPPTAARSLRRGRHLCAHRHRAPQVEHQDVLGDRRAREPALLRCLGNRGLQRAERKRNQAQWFCANTCSTWMRLERVAFRAMRKLVRTEGSGRGCRRCRRGLHVRRDRRSAPARPD